MDYEKQDTTPAAEVAAAEASADSTAAQTGTDTSQAEAPFKLTVKYNHEYKDLDEEAAKQYAQKGMRYDAISGTYDRFKAIATGRGLTVEQLADKIVQDEESALYNDLLEKASGNEDIAKQLLEVEKSKRASMYESAKAKEAKDEEDADKALTERIASEFADIQKERGYKSITEMPREVVESALRGKPLLDALLVYEHTLAAQKREAEARAKSSSGRIEGNDSEPSSVNDAFLAGLNR